MMYSKFLISYLQVLKKLDLDVLEFWIIIYLDILTGIWLGIWNMQ